MLRFSVLFLCLFLFMACNSNEGSATQSTSSNTPPPTSEEALYPSITIEEMKNLWDNTTSIDYLFYDLPISMNMVERSAIESTLKQISNIAPPINKDCKAMGRVFFLSNGDALAEADFFFAKGCTYFVFMENQKPVKANQMTPAGAQFFQNLLSSASQNQ